MPWLLLLCLAATGGILQAVAQADLDFVSLDCGLQGETSYVDGFTNLTFTTDAGFIDAGITGTISRKFVDASARKAWNTVRSFPVGTRNCYTIRLRESGVKYLIRGKFLYGNYDGLNQSHISFDLYVGVNFWMTVNISSVQDPFYAEAIVVVPENFVEVCLVNTSSGIPFINGLDLRPLKTTLYPQANETHGLVLVQRINFGPSNTSEAVRYSADLHDRIWFPLANTVEGSTDRNTKLVVHNDDDVCAMPNVVMQTAIEATQRNIELDLYLPSPTLDRCISIMHFSELEALAGNDSRQFDISVNDKLLHEAYKPKYLSSDCVYFDPTECSEYRVSISPLANSTLPPIINAMELFSVISTTTLSTNARDASAIRAIKIDYKVHKNWMGDPCFPDSLAWDGLNCGYASSKPPTITSVNLSFNGLYGYISPSFGNMTNLQYLDLSHNNLEGSIPEELSHLPSLMIIDLSNNQLTGSIPSGLLKRSQSGHLDLKYDNNPNLCTSSSCQGKSKRVIIIVVIIILIMIVVLSVGVLLFFLQRRKKRGSITNSSKMRNNEMASSASNNDGYTDSSLPLENRRFTYKELVMITKNFRQVLGEGGFGRVYHGILENGIQVAVKLRSHSSDQGVKEFLVEAQVLSRIHHKNLVAMIGYCKEQEHMAVVYEYMPEGNLHEHIAGKDRNGRCLTWGQRLRIALESSQGLEYLHKGCNPPLIHRDVKATNVLLNTEMVAKIADFGMSKAFSVNTNAHVSTFTLVGTPGYVDPEYQATMQPSTRSDVYSFGVVLLELITGKPAIVPGPEPIRLVQWAHKLLSQGEIEAVVDTRMQGDYDVNNMWKTAEIALKCTGLDSLERPTMTEVVVQLQECLQLEEGRIGVETTNEFSGGSNTRFETDQPNFQRAPTMDIEALLRVLALAPVAGADHGEDTFELRVIDEVLGPDGFAVCGGVVEGELGVLRASLFCVRSPALEELPRAG
ncbi:unnamed protein product [Alopecurus aequalis]